MLLSLSHLHQPKRIQFHHKKWHLVCDSCYFFLFISCDSVVVVVVVVVAHILIKTHICWMRAEWWQYTRIMHDTYTYSFSFLTLYLFHSLTSSCVQFVFDFFLLYFRLVLYAVCVCVCVTQLATGFFCCFIVCSGHFRTIKFPIKNWTDIFNMWMEIEHWENRKVGV